MLLTGGPCKSATAVTKLTPPAAALPLPHCLVVGDREEKLMTLLEEEVKSLQKSAVANRVQTHWQDPRGREQPSPEGGQTSRMKG